MEKDLNAEIERAAKVIEVRREEAEQARSRLMGAVAVAVTGQLPAWVERYLTETHAELTSKLSDRIPRVKQELGALCDAMPAHVRRWLDHDGYWQHRRGYEGAQDKFYGNYSVSHHPVGRGWDPPLLGRIVQPHVREVVAALVKQFGYPAPQTHQAFSIKWDDVVPTLNEYADAVQKFKGAQQTHAGAVRDKSQHDAKAIWSKA